MDKNIYKNYLAILREEMIPAMGCTEPIALAYGAARAREILGKEPERIVAKCSGNIIKNVRCVIIPNSGGLKGIPAGVILGAVGIYQPLIDFAGAGASVPLTGFGALLAKGVRDAIAESGAVGILTGGLTASAGGITAAIVCALTVALVFRPKDKA